MAAPMDAGNAAAPDSKDLASAGSSMDNTTIQYSMILDHLIGDKRPVKELNPAVMGGLPVPAKSDEQKMIERGMESCAFKSALACVGGTVTLTLITHMTTDQRVFVCLCSFRES